MNAARTDVLIIGSGISSLTSAALLAAKGKKVRVLEAYTKPGGYMHSFSRFGEIYDTGAHYTGALGPGQPFHTILDYLGVYREDLFEPLADERFDVFRFPDFEAAFSKGYDRLIPGLVAEFPHEADAIRAYFARVQATVKNFPHYEFSDRSENDIAGTGLDVSLASVVEPLTSNPKLKCVLYAYCVLHGVYPEEAPFGFHAIMTDSLIRGAYGLRGGGDHLAKSFVRAIEAKGGEVLCKKRVTEMRVGTDRLVKEVRTEDGGVYTADWVIAGIHPKAAFRLLRDESGLAYDPFTPVFRERMTNLEESLGIFGVYATTKDAPPVDPHRNFYYFDSSDPETFFDTLTPDQTPKAVFLSSANRRPSPEAKNFAFSLHAAGPIEWFDDWRGSRFGKRPAEYAAKKEAFAENIFRAVERYEPGLRAKVGKYVSSTPLTHLHFNGSEDGTSYGLYHSIANTGARAIGPRTKVINLLLTGQSTLFPGLLGAAVSALRTTGHIIGIKPIIEELRLLGRKNESLHHGSGNADFARQFG
ncbi:MAG: NAD(P)/FAD-dependent oxidoreductase [Bdellovibrionales bacterium]|nr:NAD(P)/FAD-dependent oxidoreductase [Bdellovibrionales bacterium]